jgi:hypothetical protein
MHHTPYLTETRNTRQIAGIKTIIAARLMAAQGTVTNDIAYCQQSYHFWVTEENLERRGKECVCPHKHVLPRTSGVAEMFGQAQIGDECYFLVALNMLLLSFLNGISLTEVAINDRLSTVEKTFLRILDEYRDTLKRRSSKRGTPVQKEAHDAQKLCAHAVTYCMLLLLVLYDGTTCLDYLASHDHGEVSTTYGALCAVLRTIFKLAGVEDTLPEQASLTFDGHAWQADVVILSQLTMIEVKETIAKTVEGLLTSNRLQILNEPAQIVVQCPSVERVTDKTLKDIHAAGEPVAYLIVEAPAVSTLTLPGRCTYSSTLVAIHQKKIHYILSINQPDGTTIIVDKGKVLDSLPAMKHSVELVVFKKPSSSSSSSSNPSMSQKRKKLASPMSDGPGTLLHY